MTINNEILEKFADYPVFTYRDVRLYFKGREEKTRNLARIMSYLKSTGKICTVVKGVYAMKKDNMASGFAFAPFYYGLLSALTIRELWTQNSRPEILTIKKVRTSKVAIFGENSNTVFVHHISAKHFFGFEVLKYGKMSVPVSDPEKTLIDLFYYKVRLAIQNYGGLLKAVNTRKLNGYLKKYDKRTAASVRNFVKKYKKLADLDRLESAY